MEKKPHPHALLMMEYAKDAAEDAKAYENWEYKSVFDNNWQRCLTDPTWLVEWQFRRKPKLMMTIGNVQFPAPETYAPADKQQYFYPSLTGFYVDRMFGISTWDGGFDDVYKLKRGLVHLTKEAANDHAKALIALTTLPD